MVARLAKTEGQSTVEWIGLITLIAILFAAVTAAGVRIPAAGFAHSVSKKILCAASISGGCAGSGSLEATYGNEIAGLVRAGVPTLMYGRDMLGLPVDYRTCRSSWCADGTGDGEVSSSTAGEPVTLFTRVIRREGSTYVQYWAYYPESASLRGAPVLEEEGYHPHDWESVQVRVEPDGTVSQRASSHAGYNHTRSAANWGSDMGWDFLTDATEAAGLREEGGWGEPTGRYLIAGGSHAGNVAGDLGSDEYPSYTPAGLIRLVPLESIKDGPLSRPADFNPITPPWEKQVWNDGEAEGTG
ncbi:MAG: hypothetical protein KDB52_01650 [Solirubrobacterales bacterium]|nr:hypothetical protein [Solirubrobacterales bacterium]